MQSQFDDDDRESVSGVILPHVQFVRFGLMQLDFFKTEVDALGLLYPEFIAVS